MPSIYLIAFEVVVLILFLLCLRHAWRIGPEAILRLIAGVLFGVLLEIATIRQLEAYQYGSFVMMFSDVPLAIGFGWGTIIYSAKLISDSTNLPVWARPILDGLLALNIDMAMDAVAIRLGMWDWGQGLDFQYFGVPFANFWAWFWVVTSFSAGERFLSSKAKGKGRWFVSLGALLFGLISVLLSNAFIVYVVPPQFYYLTIALTLGGSFLLVLVKNPKFIHPLQFSPAFFVPFAFHAYFIFAGLFSGHILSPPILLAISILMMLVSTFIHRQSRKGNNPK